MGKKLGKSEKSSLAGSDFGEFPQGHGVVKKEKGPKKEPHGPVQGSPARNIDGVTHADDERPWTAW